MPAQSRRISKGLGAHFADRGFVVNVSRRNVFLPHLKDLMDSAKVRDKFFLLPVGLFADVAGIRFLVNVQSRVFYSSDIQCGNWERLNYLRNVVYFVKV